MTVVRSGNRPFTLDVPADWMVVDLDSPDRIPAQLAVLIDRAVEADPGVARHRGLVGRQIRSVLRQARAGDLVLCALLATVVDNVLPMLATLTVAHRPLPDGSDVSGMLTNLQRRPGAAVSRVELVGAGPAVRAAFRDRASHAWTEDPVEASVVQYFIPARPDTVAVITCATPVLMLAEEFAELFDAIADSFEFTTG